MPSIKICEKGVLSLYISFQNHNTQAGTGKFIHKQFILAPSQTGLIEMHKIAI